MKRTDLIALAERLAAGTITDSEADRLADFLRQIAQAQPVAWVANGFLFFDKDSIPGHFLKPLGKEPAPLYTLPLED